ncbi:MAG: aminotransferase class I/II-fold pyridoxal phosphate-dependent enzyme [Planctomycetes bacterium]|nr:aminotransferase class I/II-fold pyridoxal phosphate-dependent enzyme [Planctomycetota bacterium]
METPAQKSIREEFLPFSRPTIGDEEINEVVETLRSGWITTGARTQKFEEACRAYVGAEHALAVSSATAGLHIALLALGIGPGDEVIAPSITFAATINVIEMVGATPVFADVDRDTLLIDCDAVESAISARTKAVIPVHYAGQPADMARLEEICRRHGLALLEDAAHAIGTRYGDRNVGADSRIAVFSFHPIKNMTTGEGGLITTSSAELADRLRLYRFHGMSKDAWKRYDKEGTPHYDIVLPGYKYNFMDIQAAIGIHQVAKLESFIERRSEIARRYDAAFGGIDGISPLKAAPYPARHARHLYVVRIEDRAGVSRDDFIRLLGRNNVGTGIHFTAIHLQPYYRNKYPHWEGRLPNSEWNSARIVSLPIYPLMSDSDAEDVIAACRLAVGSEGRQA